MTLALAIIGLLSGLVTAVTWYLKTKPSIEEQNKDEITKAEESTDADIDKWIKNPPR